MSSVPDEIYLEVLSRLPVRSTYVCKCVCKTWFSIISNPNFVKKHLNHSLQRNKPTLMLKGMDGVKEVIYSIGHDSLKSLLSRDKFLDYAVEMDYPFNSPECLVDLLGCCHGLVCLWLEVGDGTFLCLWNPATKEYKQVPKSPDDHDDMNQMSMVAFGYDSKNDDYNPSLFIGLNSWKRIENVEFRSFRDAGVLVNEDLHWLAGSKDSSRKIVVSLDMSEEIFKEMQLPKTSVSRPHRFMTVGALEGCLCVLGSVICLQAEVWVMQDYGVDESWTKRYVINHESVANDYLLRLVWSFKSGEILFGISSNGSLISYDPNYRRLRSTNLLRVTHLQKEGSYCESLISPNSNTYQGRTRGTNRSVPRHRGGLDSLD